jgi:energy-coupling factor transporter transmembrane protein EcfT
LEIDQILNDLNNLRLKTERKLTLFIICVIILAFLLLKSIPIRTMEEGFANVFVILIVITIVIIQFGKKVIVQKYRNTFKISVIPLLLKQFGNKITYSQLGLEENYASRTGMFGHFTKYSSEDTVNGKIDDVNFKCSDVKLGYYSGSGKHRRYVPVCHGQLYIFDFNKQFKTNTIIRERNGKPSSNLSKIELENVQFNNQFNIYSNNQHDTFYILTPHFMEKLLLLESKHAGDLFMAFYNNQLYLGIHNNKDRFEPPLFEPITNNTIAAQLSDLKIIKNLIEELRLNEKIFII